METIDILIKNASELITLPGKNSPRIKHEMNDLGIIKGGSIAIKNGRIVDVGKNLTYDAATILDAMGKIVLPGFIDPHTHVVFAGTREFELDWKLKGLNYLQINKKGGGIKYTVTRTRKATYSDLYRQSLERLQRMLKYGTTTCEAKSGYGLNTETEMKVLDVQQQLDKHQPIDIVSTFLGAHSIPEEVTVDDYVNIVIDEMIPQIKKKAIFCDVFCEKGFFSYNHSEQILEAGKKHGLIPKVHADELSDMNGGILAAKVGAISADHLLKINSKSIHQMAKQHIVGVLLPGTPFSLMMKDYAPARTMIDNGVPIALATDLNPNCYVENMQLIIQLACFNMQMTPAEAITAATINAACAINKQETIGSLNIGKQADLLIMNIKNHMMIPYHFGTNHVDTIIKNGKIITKR
jgi:imidazolonepropionase